MKPPDIERIVREEQLIEPSARFTSRVMRSVRADVADWQPRRLAWRELWPGLALASILIPLVVAGRFLGGSDAAAGESVQPALWLSVTIVGTLGLASWCTGLLTRR